MESTFYFRYGKRWLDVTCSALGLVVLSPLLFAAAMAIRLTSSGPVFFRQVRVGLQGRTFRIFKFRTMVQDAALKGSSLTAEDDPRITRTGKWLRKSKIDELPQLFNVIAGDMSLVGPRPEVPQFVASYPPAQRKVLDVRPGVTGPSIIIDEEERLACHADREKYYIETILPLKLSVDLAYTEHIRFWHDLKVILNTLPLIAGRIGVGQRSRVPMAQRES